MQFPLFADHSVGFGLVSGGYDEPSTALVQPPCQGQPWGCPRLSRAAHGEREGTLSLLCPIFCLLSAGLAFGRCQKCCCPWLVQLCGTMAFP